MIKKNNNYKKTFIRIFSFIFFIFLISFTSAQYGYNIYPETEVAANYSVVNINSSEYWDNLDTPADMPFYYNYSGITSVNCTDCNLSDLGDVNTVGVANGYALIFAGGTSTWGAKSLASLTGWVIDETA